MQDADGRPLDDQRARAMVEPSTELSEADLECVVGGLARPWTESEDEWIVDSSNALL
jgi:hypothetical protein